MSEIKQITEITKNLNKGIIKPLDDEFMTPIKAIDFYYIAVFIKENGIWYYSH